MDRYVLEIDRELRFTVAIGDPVSRTDTPPPTGILTPHHPGVTGTAGIMENTETEEA